MRLVKLFVVAISCCLIGASPHNVKEQCIHSLPEDTGNFGFSVAVNDKYLAVSDLGENRVIIYTLNNFGQWIRTREIETPLDDLTVIKFGHNYSFGRDLQLEGDALVINSQIPAKVGNLKMIQRNLIRLDSEEEITAINLPMEKKDGLVFFNILSEGKIKQIILPDNREQGFGEHNGFSYNFAFDSNGYVK